MSLSILMLLGVAVLVGAIAGYRWRSTRREQPSEPPTDLSPMAPPERSAVSDAEVSAAIEQAIWDNNLIQAIKLYRDLHGVGLKEAKDEVEAMRADLLRRRG